MKQNHPLGKLILFTFLELAVLFGVVWFFDPFYQYHAFFGDRKAVLYDRDNQVVGTVRNFSYDSVLMGSSVAENFDTAYLDSRYGCRTIKVIKASGSLADLLYYLDMAHEKQALKNVFWCLDMFALEASPEPTIPEGVSPPAYLRTGTLLDDIPYIYNKEVLFEKIPLQFAYARLDKNTGGNAYNWAEGKEFNAARAKQVYFKPDKAQPPKDFTGAKDNLEKNLTLLTQEIAAHPETSYRFILPPYSLLWWDAACMNGELEKNFYILEQTLPALLAFDNVEVYYFQADRDIVCDLDNYMDMIHYSPEINQYMFEQLDGETYRVTKENYADKIAEMRKLAKKITEHDIYKYYKTTPPENNALQE